MFLALDTETTGLGYWDTAFCVSYAGRDTDGSMYSGVCKVGTPEYYIRSLFVDETELVFHNAKFDVQKLVLCGTLRSEDLDWTKIHDTECLSHLLDEQRPKALKALAKSVLGLETDEAEELKKVRRKLGLTKADGFDALPFEVLEPYARMDAEYTLLLFEKFWPLVESDPDLLRLYREEQELMGVLYEMEERGLGVDLEYVNSMTKELAHEILETDLHIRDLVGNEEFNPNSPKQVSEALKARGHTPPDTKKVTLQALGDGLADSIVGLRHAVKQHGTYFKNIALESKGGVLHPNFKQWGTKGRRFSSGGTEES